MKRIDLVSQSSHDADQSVSLCNRDCAIICDGRDRWLIGLVDNSSGDITGCSIREKRLDSQRNGRILFQHHLTRRDLNPFQTRIIGTGRDGPLCDPVTQNSIIFAPFVESSATSMWHACCRLQKQ